MIDEYKLDINTHGLPAWMFLFKCIDWIDLYKIEHDNGEIWLFAWGYGTSKGYKKKLIYNFKPYWNIEEMKTFVKNFWRHKGLEDAHITNRNGKKVNPSDVLGVLDGGIIFDSYKERISGRFHQWEKRDWPLDCDKNFIKSLMTFEVWG